MHYFIKEISSLKNNSPVLQDYTSDVLSFSPDKLSVTYTGKLNLNVPACIQCSQAAHAFPGTNIYYFEITIKALNPARPGIVIGFTEEFFQKTRAPGCSKKSFGLKSDGKLLRDQTQILDFCSKFSQSDTIGAGICYISQKVFFTKNGSMIGKPFDVVESYPLFASVSLSSANDTVSFNFEGNFVFDLKDLVREESQSLEDGIENEEADSRTVFKLVKDYLYVQGYSETLSYLEKFMIQENYEKNSGKSRSYSGRISERYDSIDINPSCENCEASGKLCKFCVKKIIENVEAGNGIRLPEARNRCDSVDVCSLFLKSVTEEDTEKSAPDVRDVKIRGNLRKLISSGRLADALSCLTENFPEMLNDDLCMLYFNVQEFIELVKVNEPLRALEQARDKLAKYRQFTVYFRDGGDFQIPVWEIAGLLAYQDPFSSPLKKLLERSQLELTADLVNLRITQRLREGNNTLEDMVKQILAVQQVYLDNVLMNKVEKVVLNI